jgi:uncharacterized membrane protein
MEQARAFRVALMLLFIFVAGGFCGWWIGSSTAAREERISPPRGGVRSPMAQKERLVDEFTTDLGLTPEQRAGVDKVLSEWALQARQVNQDEIRARYAAWKKYSPLVRTNFTAEQQKIYDRKSEQTERRFQRMLPKP